MPDTRNRLDVLRKRWAEANDAIEQLVRRRSAIAQELANEAAPYAKGDILRVECDTARNTGYYYIDRIDPNPLAASPYTIIVRRLWVSLDRHPKLDRLRSLSTLGWVKLCKVTAEQFTNACQEADRKASSKAVSKKRAPKRTT